ANTNVVTAARTWLSFGPVDHAMMECLAITAFENDAVNGHFLTTQGLTDTATSPNPVDTLAPDNPFAQFDGGFTPVTGAVTAVQLSAVAGSQWKPNVTLMVDQPGELNLLWITGYLDGNPSNGRVPYLTG